MLYGIMRIGDARSHILRLPRVDPLSRNHGRADPARSCLNCMGVFRLSGGSPSPPDPLSRARARGRRLLTQTKHTQIVSHVGTASALQGTASAAGQRPGLVKSRQRLSRPLRPLRPLRGNLGRCLPPDPRQRRGVRADGQRGYACSCYTRARKGDRARAGLVGGRT